jgi:hypothetical protein
MEDFWGFLFAGAFTALWIGWFVLILVAGWKVYVKAGQKGWVALIPILNFLGLLKIIHKPWWWILLAFIPLVNIVIWVLMYSALAKAFGRGLGTALVLIFLTPIGYLVLGFGDADYELEEDPLFA